jgi:hypothetical protein
MSLLNNKWLVSAVAGAAVLVLMASVLILVSNPGVAPARDDNRALVIARDQLPTARDNRVVPSGELVEVVDRPPMPEGEREADILAEAMTVAPPQVEPPSLAPPRLNDDPAAGEEVQPER